MKISLKNVLLNLPEFFILVIIILNLFLTTIPLTNTVGYELAVVNGILLFLIGGIIGINLLRKNLYKNFSDLLIQNYKLLTLLVMIPFFIGIISSIIVSKCPITDGVFFYLIITIPSFIFGIVTGFFTFALSRKFSLLIFLLLFFVILFIPLFEFYFNPQIYFFNPIFGYYPGTIYDEDLSVDRILIAYRIFNLAFFIGLVIISKHYFTVKRKRKVLVLSAIAIILIIFFFMKPALQFATDKNRLEANLKKSVTTESFRIYFPDSVKIKDIEYAALLHEYYLDQIKINFRINIRDKIASYIFQDRNQKRLLLGAGNADIAKPWLNQIYLNYANYEQTVKHELSHVLAGEFGVTPFKVADGLSPSMIEGYAMAMENNYDGYPVHYMAKLASQSGYKFPVEKLFTGLNFFTKASAISYISSGSFIKYLSDKFGSDKIKKLYGNSNFTKIYGNNISALAVEYNDFLKNYLIDSNKYKAQLYFGGTTIFKKFCPRVAAANVKKGWKLFQEKKIDDAIKLFQEVYSYSGSYQSLIGVIASLSEEKKYKEARKFLSEQLPAFRSSSYFFYIELLYGDLLIQNSDSSSAVSIYDSLLLQNPHVDYTNEVMIRKTILEEGIDSLKIYFDKSDQLKQQKLLNLNREEIKYFSIPTLIQYSERINQYTKELLNELKQKIRVTDKISSYAAMKISRLALKNSDYETAQYFAVLALNFKQDDNSTHRYIENLRVVNWFKNNAEDLEQTFRYSK